MTSPMCSSIACAGLLAAMWTRRPRISSTGWMFSVSGTILSSPSPSAPIFPAPLTAWEDTYKRQAPSGRRGLFQRDCALRICGQCCRPGQRAGGRVDPCSIGTCQLPKRPTWVSWAGCIQKHGKTVPFDSRESSPYMERKPRNAKAAGEIQAAFKANWTR